MAGDPVCKNNYLTTLTVRVILAYFEKVFVTLNDKTDSHNPEKSRKLLHLDFRNHLKTMVPWGQHFLALLVF